MSQAVTIIDYGIGNLLNVVRAFEHCGATVTVTEDPADILAAERLVLPGVGAFADGMEGLGARNLIAPIKAYAAQDRPFLGICLGMQMMFDSSDEFGRREGLGLIPGEVVAIPAQGTDGHPHKIPHIGWNGLQPPAEHRTDFRDSALELLSPGTAVYFVHSFTAQPSNPVHRLADAWYNGQRIAAAVKLGNLYGCQFHPEKSAENGLNIIRSFLSLRVPSAACN